MLIILVYIGFMNTGSNDYDHYVWMYNGWHSDTESGFVDLLELSNKVGLSFAQFQGLILTFCILIDLYVFSRFSDNYNMFFALYCIYQFFSDVNLLRNTLMKSFILLALYFLIKNQKVFFALLIVFASFIHRTAIVYLPLLFFNTDKPISKKTLKILISSITLICSILFIIGNRFEWLYNIAANYYNNSMEKVNYYFTTSTRFGFLVYFALHLSCLILIINNKKEIMYLDESIDKQKLCNWVYIFNIYALVSFPLIMMNINFFRIYNNLYFVNIISFAVIIDCYNKLTRSYYIKVILFLFINIIYILPIIQGSNQRDLILNSI